MAHPDNRKPLSAVLRELAATKAKRISVEQLTHELGGRALAGLVLIFGLACALPLPPGSTTILGLPLLLLALQLMVGAKAPWLPEAIREKSVATADVRKRLPKALSWLKKLEAVSKPRLSFLFGAVGRRVIGLVCAVLAVVLILPIPLGNMLPAIAVSLLALSLVQRDGVLALAGYGVAIASVAVLVLAANVVAAGLHHLLAVFSHA